MILIAIYYSLFVNYYEARSEVIALTTTENAQHAQAECLVTFHNKVLQMCYIMVMPVIPRLSYW